MKFFVPAADDPAQEASVYASIKAFLGTELGAEFSRRRIQRLSWWHDGRQHIACVGETTGFNRELVVAILYEPKRDLYHVCTPNRGVLRDMSILAGASSVTSVVDFEGESPPT